MRLQELAKERQCGGIMQSMKNACTDVDTGTTRPLYTKANPTTTRYTGTPEAITMIPRLLGTTLRDLDMLDYLSVRRAL